MNEKITHARPIAQSVLINNLKTLRAKYFERCNGETIKGNDMMAVVTTAQESKVYNTAHDFKYAENATIIEITITIGTQIFIFFIFI